MRRKKVCDPVWSRYNPFHYRTISLRDKVLTTYGDDNWATCAHSLLHPPTRPLGLPASWHLIQWDSCWEQRSQAAVDIKPRVFSLSLLKNQDMEANEVRDHGNHNNDVSRGWISHSVSLCGPGLVSGWLFTQTSILLPLNYELFESSSAPLSLSLHLEVLNRRQRHIMGYVFLNAGSVRPLWDVSAHAD